MKKDDKRTGRKNTKLGINRETIKKLDNDSLAVVHGGDSLKTMCSPLPTLRPACP